TRYQPNPLRCKKISDTQSAIVTVVALGPGDAEQRLLRGAAQDRIPGRRRQQAHIAAGPGATDGDHHRRTGALQNVAVRADEDNVAGALPGSMAESGHV